MPVSLTAMCMDMQMDLIAIKGNVHREWAQPGGLQSPVLPNQVSRFVGSYSPSEDRSRK